MIFLTETPIGALTTLPGIKRRPPPPMGVVGAAPSGTRRPPPGPLYGLMDAASKLRGFCPYTEHNVKASKPARTIDVGIVIVLPSKTLRRRSGLPVRRF